MPMSLLIAVRTLSLLRSRHKNPLSICLVIYIGLVHDKFCLMFLTVGKAHGLQTFLKCEVGLGYRFILAPLF
jgi:hypothetical protein